MKVVIETSALIAGAVFWKFEHGNVTCEVKDKYYEHCSPLFDVLKELSRSREEIGIITKTVENEAKNALENAVKNSIARTHFPDLEIKFKIMALQHIIYNECLDRLERIVEETSVRLPIDLNERERIKNQEIIPFLEETIKDTVRYIQPSIPRFIRGPLRDELTGKMLEALPSKGIIYKGPPRPKDYVIMAEAAMICRRYEGKEEVFVASKDNHFKPNPIRVGSYLSPKSRILNEVDTTIRDRIAKKFGFIGEDPIQVTEILMKKYQHLLRT